MFDKSRLMTFVSENPISLPRSLLQWCHEGARTSVFKKPRWEGLETNAIVMAVIVLAGLLLTLAFQRLYIVGQATFYWRAMIGGLFGTALYAWVCYLVCTSTSEERQLSAAPSVSHLLTMFLAQSMSLTIGLGIIFAALIHTGIFTQEVFGSWGIVAVWLAPGIWALFAQLVLLWRGSSKRAWPVAFAMLMIIACTVLFDVARPAEFWYPVVRDDTADSEKYLKLTQEIIETQPKLLAKRLEELKPHRAGDAALYAITFAPYADEVFRKESNLVADVMARRFNARERVLELVNNAETAEVLPWATPLNLQRAIRKIAQIMDREKDILFIHLTSHGAKDGQLSAYFWPLELEPLHPAELRQWLDDAGIRNRVISVSACYSGSWIDPLENENTLVMTAADAQHTSYGCGSKSDLTFFGRAMYDEQLRNNTLSFEDAYKAARQVIEQREKDAGKEDGFSNPQIRVGAKIRERLDALEKRILKLNGQTEKK